MAKEISEALFKAQAEMPDLKMNARNPHFRNAYITLDAVLEGVVPILRKHDILLQQVPDRIGDTPALRTVMLHIPTGSFVQGELPLILQKNDPQGVGSAITYARRYAIMSMLNLTADEDDDGESARVVVNQNTGAPPTDGPADERVSF